MNIPFHAMRNAFLKELSVLANNDPSIMLLTGDLGFNALEPFRDSFPKQFLNVGVAEQNMVGIAAGFALSGRRVFAYSIIPFVTFRCLEQVRDDLCYHRLPVCMVGVGSGYAYGILGTTHHPLEDIAVMRSLPEMSVIAPGDPLEVAASVRAIAVAEHGPWYLRLGKAGEPNVHKEPPPLHIGKALELSSGSDITMIATGSLLETAATVTARLQKAGVSVRFLSMHTLKPLDFEAIESAAKETRMVVTLEEHGPIGGLGSAVAEVIARFPSHPPFLPISAPDAFADTVGSQQYLRERAGLGVDTIEKRILEAWGRKTG